MPNVDASRTAGSGLPSSIHQGWFRDMVNSRLSAITGGIEAFRIAKSTTSGDTSRVEMSVAQSSAATSGSIRSYLMTHTQTAASTGNQVEAFTVKLVSDVKTGAWANAIFAQIDYSTNGLAHGVGSAICAEISLPGSSVVRGTYYAWQTEIDCPANCAMNGNPIAVMSVSVWGDNKTQFDDVGLLFDISGVASGDGKFWYDTSSNAADEFIKVRTPSGIRYLILSDSSTFS